MHRQRTTQFTGIAYIKLYRDYMFFHFFISMNLQFGTKNCGKKKDFILFFRRATISVYGMPRYLRPIRLFQGKYFFPSNCALNVYFKSGCKVQGYYIFSTKLSHQFLLKVYLLTSTLKSNLSRLYNKGHNFWKSVSTWKIPQNWIYFYYLLKE